MFDYSGDFHFLGDEITLPVKYGSDWKRARAVLRGLVNEVLVGYAEEVKESWRNGPLCG